MRENENLTTDENCDQTPVIESSIPLDQGKIFELNHNGISPITDQGN